ncbi:MAG: hypothetical protein BGO96_12430 [Micrococcales bacterium 73-15]|uniref:hypothetical protein n=1 Tax=Salana multivorans TaxID=120377 RepID=UPI0009638B33|nr:hypothetical protein [Salana multivorans]OJX97740.1 MAG: hypothetical protein BGO96_12430 [Micrococcales bacterium 73-15]
MTTVDPEALVTAGSQVLGHSVSLGTAWQDGSATIVGLATAAAGFSAGNTAAGAAVISAHVGCSEAADSALDTLRAVLEVAADSLYTCGFGYGSTDEDAAARFEQR